MKYFYLIIFWSVLIVNSTNAQVKLGLHNGYSDYIGLYHELSVETTLYKRLSLQSRIGFSINRGTLFRTGLVYSIPVFKKSGIRLGMDLGSFLEKDVSRDGFKQSYFMYGFGLGVEHQFNRHWGILAEFGAMSLLRENKKILASFPQIGVTYRF